MTETTKTVFIKTPISRRRRISYLVIAVAVITLFDRFLFDPGQWPPYEDLKTIEGSIVKVVNNKKADDFFVVLTNEGEEVTLTTRFVGDSQRKIERLLELPVLVKYREAKRLGFVSLKPAEIYLNGDLYYGNYKNQLKNIKKGKGDYIFKLLIWAPLFIFIYAVLKRPLKKD